MKTDKFITLIYWKTYVKFYLVVIVSAIFHINGISQTSISGIINKYGKVTSIDNVLKDRVIIDAPANFVAGDTVLFIQMKGAVIDTISSSNLIYSINGAGKYEFIQVSTVNNSTGLTVFTTKFLNNYDTGEAIQLVKVPSYNSAKVSGPLTCIPWDGNKGGIVSFFVMDTLELGADIDVSGKGFKGADPIQFTGTCGFGVRYYTNPVAGKKGEGIVGMYFNKYYGNGFLINGGGGGNGLYAGGGGGGGVGHGSKGNKMNTICTDITNKTGGEAGIRLNDYINGSDYDHKDRIFFGGGGGSGTFPVGAISAKGGNGGGIVFILTRYLKNPSNQYTIKANGEDVSLFATNDAGTGGGGGGGNILISAEKVIGTLKAQVKGGYGGGNDGFYCWGQGGGGGGGLVWLTSPISGTIDTLGGQKGDYRTGGCVQTTQASDGFSLKGLNPVLNGFLYNLIGEPHTICYGQPSKLIVGSTPRGGNGNYTYLWQKRKYNIPTWTTISGYNSQNYTAPALYDSTFFRRVVTTTKKNASGVDVLIIDTSKVMLVKVIPQIKNNTVNPVYIEICSGQSPVQLIGGSATRQGDPSPTYFWKTNKPRAAWVDGINPNTLKDYLQTYNTSLSISDTTFYHRIVSSSICKDTITATIIVHPILKNDSIWVNLGVWNRQEICNGTSSKQIRGTIPTGGKSGKYSYRWEKSADALSWSLQIDSSNLNVNLSPVSLTQSIYYRRITYSGLNSVCKDTSKSFFVKVWPKISNNTILSSQSVICEETSPDPFVNSLPAGGTESYLYQWIKSPNNKVPWDSISNSSDISKYPDSKLSVAASFKRLVRSGLYDCCKDSSNTISFSIQPKFRNDSISKDTTLCINQQPNQLGPRKNYILYGGIKPYKYQWYQRINNSKTWSPASNDSLLQPDVLKDTSYFRRIVISSDDVCKDTAKMIINVLPAISNNIISGDNAVCNDSTLSQIKGYPGLAGGDKKYKFVWGYKPANGSWKDAVVDKPDYQPPKLPIVNDSLITTFSRKVYSGLHDCCVDSSTTGRFDVKAFARPISGGVLRDTSITFDFTYTLIAPKPKLGRGVWTLVGYDSQPEYITDTKAKVTFPNPEITYKLQWIITTNKACPSIIDSFTIAIKDIGRYNGFSPNGDGKNDYFIVKGLQNLDENLGDNWELKILNRWGGIVYSSNIKNNRLKDKKNTMPYTELGLPIWDGKNQNEEDLAEDTYFYVLSINKKNSISREYKGFVMMKR